MGEVGTGRNAFSCAGQGGVEIDFETVASSPAPLDASFVLIAAQP